MCKPSRFIEVDILDLRTTEGYEFEQFELNDIAQIITKDQNTGEEIIEEQRIIGWSYKVFAIYDSKIELGNKTKNVVEILKQAYDNSEKADDNINDSGNISGDNIWDRNEGTNLPGLFHKCYKYIEESDHQLTIKIDDVKNSLAEFTVKVTNEFARIEAKVEKVAEDGAKALADFKLEVTNKYAKISLLATYEFTDGNGLTTSLSSISMTASANSASINNLTYVVNQNIESFTKFTQEVTNKYAKIESLATYSFKDGNNRVQTLSQLSMQADKNGAMIGLVVKEEYGRNVVNAASIVAAVNKSGSSIKIKADKIDLEGTVRFLTPRDLSDRNSENESERYTVIDGGKIDTESLTANRVSTNILRALFSRGDVIHVDRSLVIESGAALEFRPNSSLYIGQGSSYGETTNLFIGRRQVVLQLIPVGLTGSAVVLAVKK